MKYKTNIGFTIVELLIVIVVVGILAAITVVSYNGIQKRATNTAQYAEVKAYEEAFLAYRAFNGSWPSAMVSTPSGSHKYYCLGSNFPNGNDGRARCRSKGGSNSYPQTFNDTSDNAEPNTLLMQQLGTISQVNSTPKSLGIGVTGPFATRYTSGDGIELNQIFVGDDGDVDCPADYRENGDPGPYDGGILYCRKVLYP